MHVYAVHDRCCGSRSKVNTTPVMPIIPALQPVPQSCNLHMPALDHPCLCPLPCCVLHARASYPCRVLCGRTGWWQSCCRSGRRGQRHPGTHTCRSVCRCPVSGSSSDGCVSVCGCGVLEDVACVCNTGFVHATTAHAAIALAPAHTGLLPFQALSRPHQCSWHTPSPRTYMPMRACSAPERPPCMYLRYYLHLMCISP
jgi:hypothetical protein